MRRSLGKPLGVAVWLAAASALAVDPPPPKILQRAGFEQRLGATVSPDLVLRDETGAPFRLGDHFGGRPIILNLAYFECPMLCTLVVNGLMDSMKQLPFAVGQEYEVLTVSFNHRETPALAAEKKANYLKQFGRPQAGAGWHFLTGDEAAVKALCDAVGFSFQYDEKTKQYAHASGIVVLTPQGRVSHYFYGVQFDPKDLRLALVESSAGKIGTPVDQLLLFCFHYDPVMGRYSAGVMTVIRFGCLGGIAAVAAFLAVSLRREFRRRPQAHPVAA